MTPFGVSSLRRRMREFFQTSCCSVFDSIGTFHVECVMNPAGGHAWCTIWALIVRSPASGAGRRSQTAVLARDRTEEGAENRSSSVRP